MGIFKQMAQTLGENIAKSKEDRKREEDFIKGNPGSQAIAAYLARLFEKGNGAYNWIKQNKEGLYPVINDDSVSLCYTQSGSVHAQSWKEAKAQEITVGKYSFQEMYKWAGLADGAGYSRLTSRTQKNALESMIHQAISAHPYLKFNGGYRVKMFQ